MTRLTKGDKVVILTGNDRGKVGEILALKEDRVLVQGVNVRKKHMKRRSEETRSEIVSVERPIHISNVALAKEDGTKIKAYISHSEEGKVLSYKEGKKEVVLRTLKKKKK